ncbi:DNA-processing protein DprA [Candidatus Sumerlaeota bacterium]|nr:DNA-processing protein DprA [Candidatus Sumerlaeota bacterium]
MDLLQSLYLIHSPRRPSELAALGEKGRVEIFPPHGFSKSLRDEARILAKLRVSIHWRGEPDYPAKLAAAMGEKSPPWVFIWGDPARLEKKQCAVIGSRQTSPEFCAASRELSRRLAELGIAITSGMAAGADAAAHEGALETPGGAGTVCVPAAGMFHLHARSSEWSRGAMTLLSIAKPSENFNAGLAIRRNDLVAALGDGMVLAATGLKGGSSYALRWALRHGRPVWCFEAGRRTPPGNASLLKSRLARPLPLGASPENWADEIVSGLRQPLQNRRLRALPSQLDWLER